jgi:antitoxin PrlF
MKATVAERGQVTIPKELRDKLGIQPGTVLSFSAEKGKLIVKKLNADDPVTRAYGCLGHGLSSDRLIAELRGKP